MKKVIIFIITLALLLTGCGTKPGAASQKHSVVVTIFPAYDWVVNLLGDRAADWDVTFLLDNGVDLHSFQPTAEDMVQISSCDLFVCVGGVSDKWVDDVLQSAANPDLKVVRLMDSLADSLKEEELVEGMEPEDEEEDGAAYDEHVWLSLRSAARICTVLADRLAAVDPDCAADYQKNAAAYIERLNDLDARYVETVGGAARRTVLFGDRFPFRYLVDDYGLDYYAAFLGCSAESEASFETVVFLAGKVDELQLPVVLALEGTDHRLAQTIVDNTAAKTAEIVTMNSMQSVTAKDAAAGASYLSIMEGNLAALEKALGR